ncbi:MAG: hypothetical protein C0490_03745 [Marivirga sp.]|nr:hypothetical protein [Marivirga sp.]
MRLRFYFLGIVLVLFVGACNNEPSGLGVAYSVFDKSYGVVLVDTITVDVSTVLLDSIPTSGTGTLLIGGYQDSKLGTTQSEGYIQVGIGESWEPASNAVFDSLVLVARYSGYYYGDTTVAQTFEARRVTQTFKTYSLPQFWVDERQYSALFTEGSLYNSSSIRYDLSPLGSKTIRVRPGSPDSLSIRLDDNLGREWLQLAQSKSLSITNQEKFLEYFKGFAISAASAQPSCMIGFTTSDIKVRLYYKQYSNEALKQQYHEFPFGSDLFNYSKITTDRSGTVLEGLSQDNNVLSTRDTGDEAFIQSGTGVVTKVTFPHINKMIDLEDLLMVNQAQLVISPIKKTFSKDYPLPVSLTLFETNKSNLPLTRAYADYSVDTYQSAYISFDTEFDTSTGYIFTITQYVQKLLTTEGNLDKGFLIMPPPDEINQTVNKAYLGAGTNGTYQVKLKVWYTQKQ